MTIKNYLIIQENIVTNVCLWDGNTQTWQPPQDATMLIAETTPTKLWGLVNLEYVLVDSMGDASIGFTWNGTVATTNQPQPEAPIPAAQQPETTGTITL